MQKSDDDLKSQRPARRHLKIHELLSPVDALVNAYVVIHHVGGVRVRFLIGSSEDVLDYQQRLKDPN